VGRRFCTALVWLLAVALLASSAAPGLALEYHVSKSGNDSWAGSAGAPWLTIQKAASSVVAGDIVRVHTGVYEERVSESTAGGVGAPITYVADPGVIVRGFDITGDYVRIIGFEITHTLSGAGTGVSVSNAAHVEILDCNIHNTAGISIDPVGAPYLVIRGNTLSYAGSPGDNNGVGRKLIDDWGAISNWMLIEYNMMSHATDYVCSNGDYYIARNNVMGPVLTTDFGGLPHVDGWQANSQTRYAFMESNWHVDNSISDSHMILIAAPTNGVNGHFAVVKNVSLRSGDQLWFQMRDGDNLHAAHNSVGQVGFGPRGGPASSGFYYVWSQNTPSNFNFSLSNIFYNVTTGRAYAISAGSDLTHHHDHADVASDIPNGVNGNIISNPTLVSWVNYGANDLTLKATAPDIDVAAPLTTVTSLSSSGTSFVVANADWFYDGFGLTEGQKIYVGNDNNLTVTAVDYTTRTVTVSAPITWINGEGVGYAYRGNGPDLGAYEHGDTVLTAAALASAGDIHTVTITGDARFVVFYRDGIPYASDFTPPYSATISDGTVAAKAYALHAQAVPVINALPAGGAGFVPLSPCRVLDTRGAAAPVLAAQQRRVFAVTGVCGVPAGARAISANLTVVSAAALGDLRVTGGHLATTNTSALSIPLARARANNAIVQLATGGTGTIAVTNDSSASVHFILDVNGYFR
jgi:hypothetical protein